MSLIKLWKHRGKILEGLKNRIFKQEHVEEIFNYRIEICKKCDNFDEEGSECYVPGTQPCCGHCGCSLGLLLRSLSSACSDEDDPKWSALMSEEEEDELNEQLNTKDESDI